jgi:hypothetical protein
LQRRRRRQLKGISLIVLTTFNLYLAGHWRVESRRSHATAPTLVSQ